MWEMKVPVLSTAHLRKSTVANWTELKEARSDDFSHYLAEYPEGFFVYLLLAGYDEIEDSPMYKDCKKQGWSELLPILRWLHQTYSQDESVVWVRFDMDGDVVPELETFDW